MELLFVIWAGLLSNDSFRLPGGKFYLCHMRYFLELAYDGTRYHGWQIQPNARSVQQVLHETLSLLLRQSVSTTGSGRTDTGVHASQQFAHFDVAAAIDEADLLRRLNRLLPKDVAVKNIFPVSEDAHARFDALARTYHYYITLQKDPFRQYHATYLQHQPDVEQMNRAAALLPSFQDYTAFSKVKGDTPHYLCDIYEAHWQQQGTQLLFTVRANRFLRGMVRLMVGTLLDVGKGKLSVEQFAQVIAGQDRRQTSGAAPAEGLFLAKVEYPENYFENQKQIIKDRIA